MYLRTPKQYRKQRRHLLSLRFLWLWILTPVVALVGIHIYQNQDTYGPPVRQAITDAMQQFQGSIAISEIFGHRKGAFTGADYEKAGMFLSASGGTILADDIDKQVLLAMDREVFFTEPHYDGYSAVLIRLPKIKVALLKDVIAQGWSAVSMKPPRRARPRRPSTRATSSARTK